MKKIFAAVVLLMYFSVTTGFTICVHFCMDRFDSVQLGNSDSDKCHKCGMHKDGGCCRDEVKVMKLENSHLASQIQTPDFTARFPKIINNEFLSESFIDHKIKGQPIAHSPPLSGTEICRRNCIFRI